MGIIIGVIVSIVLFSWVMMMIEASSDAKKRDKEIEAERKAKMSPEEIEAENKEKRKVYLLLFLFITFFSLIGLWGLS